jgi:putative membrane protein
MVAAAVVAVVASLEPVVVAVGSGATVAVVVAMGLAGWRRVSTEWSFAVADAPDGLRITSGLLSRAAETVPRGRIQAVRMVEPLWFRSFGWCRLELHLAGGVKGGDHEQPARLRHALLPVGSLAEADWLLSRVLPDREAVLTRPPRRAAIRAPLSYHFLRAGLGENCAVAVSGRIRRETVWMPLAKVQSLQAAQGPVQRSLGLASIHMDTAGHRTRATLRDRAVNEAVPLLEELPGRCAVARAGTRPKPGPAITATRVDPPPEADQAQPDA